MKTILRRLRPGLLALLAALAAALPLPAAALTYTYSFDAITTNNAANAAAGEGQLRMELSGEANSRQVTFTFSVVGDIPMSITDIYFYYGGGLPAAWPVRFDGFVYSSPWDTTTRTGVQFTQGAWPLFLPGGQAAGLTWTSLVFSSQSGAPNTMAKGVNPGESLGLRFTLPEGKDVEDVAQALAGWIADHKLNSGDLAVGLHVQGINNGGSESFVTGAQVPLPGTLGLMAAGLAALAWRRARRGRKS